MISEARDGNEIKKEKKNNVCFDPDSNFSLYRPRIDRVTTGLFACHPHKSLLLKLELIEAYLELIKEL